jgi:hypothetical protein
MFHGAAGLGEHDVTQAGVVGRGGAISDGEVAAGVIAVEEDVDVVDEAGAVFGIGWQLEAAVG